MESHACPTKVLIIGHSFVRHLDNFLQYIDGERNVMMLGAYRADKDPVKDKLIREWKLGTELGLDTEEFRVQFVGVSGMRLYPRKPTRVAGRKQSADPRKSLTSAVTAESIAEANADLCYIEIGSNDLCDVDICPIRLAHNTVAFARYVQEVYRVRTVVLGSVLTRRGRGIPHAEYNPNVHRFNEEIASLCKESPSIHQWKHRGFYRSKRDIFSDDGIHLNFFGNGTLAFSIKRAIVTHAGVNKKTNKIKDGGAPR